ncbi:MAG: hypothetical protein ICV60_04510 [Pyrinomonadaceae bacterium]|nr:hypothetical protein [Pyrinomonadaceae bacterium]
MLNRIFIAGFVLFLLTAIVLLNTSAHSKQASANAARLSVTLQRLAQEACFQDKGRLEPHWRKVDSNLREIFARIATWDSKGIPVDMDFSAFGTQLIKVRRDGALRLLISVAAFMLRRKTERTPSCWKAT